MRTLPVLQLVWAPGAQRPGVTSVLRTCAAFFEHRDRALEQDDDLLECMLVHSLCFSHFVPDAVRELAQRVSEFVRDHGGGPEAGRCRASPRGARAVASARWVRVTLPLRT